MVVEDGDSAGTQKTTGKGGMAVGGAGTGLAGPTAELAALEAAKAKVKYNQLYMNSKPNIL